MSIIIDTNSIYYLEILMTDSNGKPVIGLTIQYKIIKSSDNSLISSGNLIDVGEGIYQKAHTFNNNGQYRIYYITPTNYTDEIETVLVKDSSSTGGLTPTQDEMLKRILGLTQENYRIFNPQYDKNNNLIGGTIKIYPTANDVDNDTNSIASYEINANFNLLSNLMKSYKVKRIS